MRSRLLILLLTMGLGLLLTMGLGACQNAPDSSRAWDILEQEQEIVQAGEIEATRQSDAGGGVHATPDALPVRLAQDTAGRREPELIRRAGLELRVRDYMEASAAVPRIVGRFDAYLAGEEERRQSYRVSNTYTIRVAAAQFDSLLMALGSLAEEVESRTVSVDDVTAEFVDLEARMRTRRAVEARYVELLGRANRVEDVLAVQEKLADVREEIERTEGRLRYLRDRVAMSTIELTLYERSATGVSAGPGFLSRLARAFETGWDIFLGGLVGFVALWPLWLLVGLGWAGYRSLRRRRRTVTKAPPSTRV